MTDNKLTKQTTLLSSIIKICSMVIEQRRCKHCNKTYGYQRSGDGCFDKLNDKEYCSDCMAVILNALKDVPVRCIMKTTSEFNFDVDFEKELLPLKEEYKEYKYKQNSIGCVVMYIGHTTEDKDVFYDQYYHNHRHYTVKYRSDGTIVEIMCDMEYDVINETFTGNPWLYYNSKDHFVETNFSQHTEKQKERSKSLTELLKEAYENKPDISYMRPPLGKLFYNVFEWEVKSKE